MTADKNPRCFLCGEPHVNEDNAVCLENLLEGLRATLSRPFWHFRRKSIFRWVLRMKLLALIGASGKVKLERM